MLFNSQVKQNESQQKSFLNYLINTQRDVLMATEMPLCCQGFHWPDIPCVSDSCKYIKTLLYKAKVIHITHITLCRVKDILKAIILQWYSINMRVLMAKLTCFVKVPSVPNVLHTFIITHKIIIQISGLPKDNLR